MLQVFNGAIRESFPTYSRTLHKGGMVRWIPQLVKLSRNPPPETSVRGATDMIIAHAENAGAYKDERVFGRRSIRSYAVCLHDSNTSFYTREGLERTVRHLMLNKYDWRRKAAIGIGSPRKIRMMVRGRILGVNNWGIELLVERTLVKNRWVKRKKPIKLTVKTRKVQLIMLSRKYV